MLCIKFHGKWPSGSVVEDFISAGRLVMLYISTKFCEIISNGIKVMEWTQFSYGKLQRGIIPQKNKEE